VPVLTTNQLLNGLPPEETLLFFATFARFEFAMKQCGYIQRTNDGDVAMACRKKLAAALPESFLQSVQDAQIAPVLIELPPKNLFVQDNAQPQFGDQPLAPTTTVELLDAVWRVRNNLFHGNKMYPTDRERDAALMGNALAVLHAIMQQNQNLSSAFHEPQQYF
jgi:hypothetical protein